MWIWLVLLYGVLKGAREICKKKALLTSSSVEVLLIYTLVAFLMVTPSAPNAMGLEPRFYFYIAIKSFVIFIAWICSFKAIKHLPLSLYGVLDLSRVLFATLLGIVVLQEKMGPVHILGLILVCTGLLMLKFRPEGIINKLKAKFAGNRRETGDVNLADADIVSNGADGVLITDSKKVVNTKEKASAVIIFFALLSCGLNAVSGLMDKILMKDINSSQLQFWYMLFLCIFYIIYALVSHTQVNVMRALKNGWIWLLALMFVIADKALFIANASPDSTVTVMTLLKQAGCIVTILGGKFVFKEKHVGYKLVCAAVVIAGIVCGVM